jgi:hypothetical protein
MCAVRIYADGEGKREKKKIVQKSCEKRKILKMVEAGLWCFFSRGLKNWSRVFLVGF